MLLYDSDGLSWKNSAGMVFLGVKEAGVLIWQLSEEYRVAGSHDGGPGFDSWYQQIFLEE